MKNFSASFVYLLAFALTEALPQATAQTIPFVAKLANKDGTPVEGNPTITYRLYTQPSGGDVAWTETRTDAVANGIVSVNLGTVASLQDVFLDEDLWLGVAVGTDSEFSPRIRAPKQPTIVRPGTIVAFGGDATKVPAGWLLCDGKSYFRDDSKVRRLFNAIETAWGAPDAERFQIPDLRGLFLRGVDSGANRDLDRDLRIALQTGANLGNRVGSYQADAIQRHIHKVYYTVGIGSGVVSTTRHNPPGADLSVWDKPFELGDPLTDLYAAEITTGRNSAETRPANAYVNYIIKY